MPEVAPPYNPDMENLTDKHLRVIADAIRTHEDYGCPSDDDIDKIKEIKRWMDLPE
jgi:hypothetical protein